MKNKISKNITGLLIMVSCILIFSIEMLSVEANNSYTLETPTNLRWTSLGSIKWDRTDKRVTAYTVCLYKDGELMFCDSYGGLSHFDYLDSIGMDSYIVLSNQMYESGSYTFTVQALRTIVGRTVQSAVSDMSDSFNYIHPGISLDIPSNLSLKGNILTWEFDNAKYPEVTGSYEIDIYEQKTGFPIRSRSLSFNETSIDLKEFSPIAEDGEYYIDMRAVSLNIHNIGHSKRSEELSFSIKDGLVIYEDSPVLDKIDISKISNKFIDLEKGEKKQLVVDMWSDNLLIKWSSSDSSVVTVDSIGVINAVGYGETIINASKILGMNDIQCYVSVKGISLNKNKIELLKDQTETLIAEFSPYSSKVKWETSDSDVASIKVDGNKCRVTPKNSGNATITAEITVDGKKMKDTCALSVIKSSPEDIAQAYADYLMNSGFIGKARKEVEDKLDVQLPIYWCAAFVGETAKDFGLSKIIPLRSGVGGLYRDILSLKDNPAKGFYFVEKDKYNVENSIYTNRNNFIPKVGDLVIFKWDSAGSNITFSHVGIVTKVENPERITVIHGNTDKSDVGKWYSLNFRKNNSEVVAFVRPDYGAISDEWTGKIKHSFECPVDVCVIFDGEELNSATDSIITGFGTMTIEEDCITVILDYGNPYNIVVTGKDEGTMKLTTEFDTNHGQNTRSFIDIPITKDTTIHVYADAATAGIELLVEPNDAEITETLWYAEPGDIVSKADEELTESYLNRSWYEEDDDSDQTEWKIWEPEYDIALDKTWTVEFNKTPDATTIKGSNIYVTDQNNQVVSTSLYQQSDKKVCVIPAKNYQSGHTYILWIKGLKAEDGSLLDKDVKMEFTIK